MSKTYNNETCIYNYTNKYFLLFLNEIWILKYHLFNTFLIIGVISKIYHDIFWSTLQIYCTNILNKTFNIPCPWVILTQQKCYSEPNKNVQNRSLVFCVRDVSCTLCAIQYPQHINLNSDLKHLFYFGFQSFSHRLKCLPITLQLFY